MPKHFRFRLKMAARAVVLIAGLGVMSALANWFCLQRLDRLDEINNALVSHLAPARLGLTEAKIAVASMGLATYKMAGSSDPDTVREAFEERDGQFAAAKAWLNGAIGYLPDRAGDVQRMIERLDLVNDIANNVYILNKAGDRERARAMLEFKFDAALVDASTTMNRLINILGGESNAAVAVAAAEKAWTYNVVLGVLFGGTIATVLLAMFLAHRSVARPLQRLAGVMRQIAEGQFDATIDGLKRSDEVGTMARAVLVFRDNGVALREAQQARAREQAAADKRNALDVLAGSFESKILSVTAALASAVTQLDESARSMSGAADESGTYARAAAAVAEETTAVAGTVANAIDELSVAMRNIDSQLVNASAVWSKPPGVPVSPLPMPMGSVPQSAISTKLRT